MIKVDGEYALHISGRCSICQKFFKLTPGHEHYISITCPHCNASLKMRSNEPPIDVDWKEKNNYVVASGLPPDFGLGPISYDFSDMYIGASGILSKFNEITHKSIKNIQESFNKLSNTNPCLEEGLDGDLIDDN